MKRYSMHFDSVWGNVVPTEDSAGAWVKAVDIEGAGKADFDTIKALKIDLDSARRQLKRQYEELKKYRGDK